MKELLKWRQDDGSLSLCNIAAQFPNVSGLKYLNKTTNFRHGVRRVKDSVFPPQCSGWGNINNPQREGTA